MLTRWEPLSHKPYYNTNLNFGSKSIATKKNAVSRNSNVTLDVQWFEEYVHELSSSLMKNDLGPFFKKLFDACTLQCMRAGSTHVFTGP